MSRGLVVLLRGVNIGGHKVLRPTRLARQLRHLGAVNIGAAGTFVIRRPIAQSQLRAEVARRLPFGTEIAICTGRQVARLITRDPFAGLPVRRDTIQFVSVMARRPRARPATPFALPSPRSWILKVLASDGPFIVGLHRRRMRVISYIGALDRLYGAPVTTRSWSTMLKVAETLRRTHQEVRSR